MSKSSNPFTKRDYDKLKMAERTIHDLLPNLDKAEACGVDCEQLRSYVTGFSQVLQAIERNFMTPAPTK